MTLFRTGAARDMLAERRRQAGWGHLVYLLRENCGSAATLDRRGSEWRGEIKRELCRLTIMQVCSMLLCDEIRAEHVNI